MTKTGEKRDQVSAETRAGRTGDFRGNKRERCSGICQKKQVDILFSDIKMPYMTGLELAKAARELQPGDRDSDFSGYNGFFYA